MINAIIMRTFSTKEAPITSLKLYKYLFRECDKLPKDAKNFYKHTIRQSYKQHVYESDPQRIKEIISKALEDSKWIANKYSKK